MQLAFLSPLPGKAVSHAPRLGMRHSSKCATKMAGDVGTGHDFGGGSGLDDTRQALVTRIRRRPPPVQDASVECALGGPAVGAASSRSCSPYKAQ